MWTFQGWREGMAAWQLRSRIMHYMCCATHLRHAPCNDGVDGGERHTLPHTKHHTCSQQREGAPSCCQGGEGCKEGPECDASSQDTLAAQLVGQLTPQDLQCKSMSNVVKASQNRLVEVHRAAVMCARS